MVHNIPTSLRLFGGHILGCANGCVAVGDALLVLFFDDAGDPKIQDFDSGWFVVAFWMTEKDIVGFEIPVNNALFVCGCEGFADLVDDGFGLVDREEGLLADVVTKGQPFEIFHGDIGAHSFGPSKVCDEHDIVVFELACCDGFSTKAFEKLGVGGKLRMEQLNGIKGPKDLVFGPIDGSHATFANFGLEHKCPHFSPYEWVACRDVKPAIAYATSFVFGRLCAATHRALYHLRSSVFSQQRKGCCRGRLSIGLFRV